MSEGISVTATVEETLPAVRATLLATLQGASVVKADRAGTTSREVVALTEAMVRIGLPRQSVRVLGALAENRIGVARSAAAFRLQIVCEDLARLADAVDVVAETRGASLDRVEWGYDDSDARRDSRLAAAIGVARRRAESAAAALGVSLGTVLHCEESQEPFPVSDRLVLGAAGAMRSRGAGAAFEDGEAAPERVVATSVRVVWSVVPPS